MTSKLNFRARTLDATKPMTIHRAEDLPDLATENAINRAVPALPTGMEKEEETEKHLQDILEAQTKGLVKKAAELYIPTPESLEEMDTAYESIYKNSFKVPRQYIHVQPFTADQDLPDYDMDEEDIKFFNEELRERKKFEVSMITFEDMIDRLEKNSGQTVVNLKEAKMLLKEDDDLILAVYDYWLNKRLETQQCLIPQVKTESRETTAGQGVDPYVGFRRRTEKMQTRKNRKNDEESYIRMLKLRRDLNRAVMLLEMVKRREKIKKENLNLTTDIFDKRFQSEDWDGQLYQQALSAKPSIKNVLQPSYQLTSWMNSASSPSSSSVPVVSGSLPLKKEKRIYKKRKHKSGLNRPVLSGGLLRPERSGILPLTPDIASSDDDRTSLNKQSDQEVEELEDMDGPFAFKRKAGVEYHSPLDDPWETTDDQATPFQLFSMAPVYGAQEQVLGFCRRRLGRGGRVVLDRIPSRWDNSWEGGTAPGDDPWIARPQTPPNLGENPWDPYGTSSTRNLEVCF